LARALLGVLFVAGCVLFLLDFCAPFAGTLLIFECGLLVGVFWTQGPSRKQAILLAAVLAVVPLMMVWRMLPVHAMDWANVDRVEIERITGKDHFEITDPAELRELEGFGSRGTLQSMVKSGYGYHITVWTGGVGRSYYVHGDAFGPMPGGFTQSIFVPSKPGFTEWFEALLTRHGYPTRN
jgi:hypothetical protein